MSNKTSHGKLNAALMAFKKLAKALKHWCLEMNPHYSCVWNCAEKSNQLTLVFYIDDVLLTHSSPAVVIKCDKKLDGVCGSHNTLTVTRGKSYEHIGMDLDFRVKGQWIFTQFDAIKKICVILPQELRGPYYSTPVPVDLFK